MGDQAKQLDHTDPHFSIVHLGPSMKSLTYTLTLILKELPFSEGPKYEIKINSHFMTSLTEAMYVKISP
jgi:hypothetical protein